MCLFYSIWGPVPIPGGVLVAFVYPFGWSAFIGRSNFVRTLSASSSDAHSLFGVLNRNFGCALANPLLSVVRQGRIQV